MYYRSYDVSLCSILGGVPDAVAVMKGAPEHSGVQGTVQFYQTAHGVLVVASIRGLPASPRACSNPVFAFHIHGGGSCSGNGEDPFADAGSHYNPDGCPHPHHAGDMPPLFGAGGRAFLAFLTDRFRVEEVIGRAVIVHDRPDDFKTQPSGDAGNKIACGIIAAGKR